MRKTSFTKFFKSVKIDFPILVALKRRAEGEMMRKLCRNYIIFIVTYIFSAFPNKHNKGEISHMVHCIIIMHRD